MLVRRGSGYDPYTHAEPAGCIATNWGADLEYAYLPTSGIVSILSPMQDGTSPEAAVIGNDGFAIASAVGPHPAPH